MAIDKNQLRNLIGRVLQSIDLHSEAAVELLMLTAAQESGLGTYIRQKGGGPALGIFQMEPATFRDLFETYLKHWSEKEAKVRRFDSPADDLLELEGNLLWQIVIARMKYLRAPGALPAADDLPGLAAYYKRHWNTPLGAATVEEAMANYRRYC
jgi:hypothetical protein